MATNLLRTAGFETDTNGDGLADDWIEEHSTATVATYTRVTSGVVEGTKAQRMQYTGESTNTGTQKVEFYQATAIGSFTAGDPATFVIWLSGSVTNGYATIVIEGHTGATYLSEVNQIVTITATPQPFQVSFPSLPAGTDSCVVVVQTPELGTTTVVDITADAARLTKQNLPALVRRVNYLDHPSFELGTTLAAGWTESNSITGSVTYTLSTTSPGYGTKKQTAAFTAGTQTNKQVQLISNTSANGTFAPGDSATFSLLVDGTLTGCNLVFRIQFMTSAGGSAGTSDSTTKTVTGTPTRLSWTAVAPASTSAARVLIRVTSIDTGDTFSVNFDGAMLEKSATAGTYFDGATSGFQWLGAADASVSSQLINYVPESTFSKGSDFLCGV